MITGAVFGGGSAATVIVTVPAEPDSPPLSRRARGDDVGSCGQRARERGTVPIGPDRFETQARRLVRLPSCGRWRRR